jgi:hypothetical protein
VRRQLRPILLTLLAVAGLTTAGGLSAGAIASSGPAPSGSAASAGQAPSARSGRLAVGVQVLRFYTAGRSVKATGMVTARLTDNTGRTSTVKTMVAMTAATGGGCRVLHLYLNELTLTLLGLRAHLDKVVLDVTGNARGGVLGSLFCKLAKAKVASARVAGARALTTAVRRRRGHVLRFTAFIHPAVTGSAAAGTVCPVLDLVVGPLNLQLLGLVVDLNRVHLNVTATRGAGALGDLFCTLAGKSVTTATTSTTTG